MAGFFCFVVVVWWILLMVSFKPEPDLAVFKCLFLFFCAFLNSHSSPSYLKFSLNSPLDQIVFYIYTLELPVLFLWWCPGWLLTAWAWLHDPLAPHSTLILGHSSWTPDALATFAFHFLDWALCLVLNMALPRADPLSGPGSCWVSVITSLANPPASPHQKKSPR